MNRSRFFVLLPITLSLLLGACLGNDDPVLDAVNDATSDMELEDFYVDRTDVYPEETVYIEWRATGAIIFDVSLYASKDTVISSDDSILVNEECGIEDNDHCTADEGVDFYCLYQADNTFNCREDGDLLQRNDLTGFFEELPQNGYLILEVCRGSDCDSRSAPMVFR